jgi:hypothetical protein
MIVKDIIGLMGNEVNIMLEDTNTEACTVYEGKVYKLHGEYLNAEVEWIRLFGDGIALRVSLPEQLTAKEQEFILQYREASKETKAAINKLLDV